MPQRRLQRSYDAVAGEYAAHLYDELAGKPLDRELLARFAGETRGRGKVCDLGCGPGQIARFLADHGADAFGLDLSYEMLREGARLGPDVAVQGNLDPTALFLPPDQLRARVGRILEAVGGAPGHIFNLGHGVLPPTNPEHVRVMVEAVRELSQR